jgi:propanol-preferring alcohol dehydrogenase
MKAMVLRKAASIESGPLEWTDWQDPVPGAREVLIQVSVCGVCHTELDEIEGRIQTHLPLILGHEVIGRVVQQGPGVTRHRRGDRVGVAWIYSACRTCSFCRDGNENLCSRFQATGCDANGGYAQYMVAPEDSAYAIPARFSDAEAAPLLCAGAIGYRDLRLSGVRKGQILGLFGFGASAHLVVQLARYQGIEVFVFTRSEEHRQLARRLGAVWTGRPDETPPQNLDAAIDFTPVGETVIHALKALQKGGRLVVAVIRKRDPIPPLDYAQLLWDEKEIKSVANITRRDAREFLPLAAEIPIVPEVQEFDLKEANHALLLLKQGKIQGAGVLRAGSPSQIQDEF